MKMTTRIATCSLFALAVCLGVAATSSAALISDDLNVDSSANYDVVKLGDPGDSTVTFAYDYSAIVGPAPNTGDASTIGVLITANETLGVDSAATVFHKTLVPANARVTVDMYMGVTGTGGTTEFGSVGIGSTGSTPLTIFSPIGGDGTFFSHTGDGGSASDWRWSRPGGINPAASVPVNSFSNTYLLGGTNAPLYDSVAGLGGNGVAGNIWVELSIETLNGTTRIFINGQEVINGPSIGEADDTVTGGTAPGGRASFSYADIFTSVASPTNSQFGIFDNFRVDVVPEPASMMLLGLGGLVLLGRRRR